MVIVEVKQNGKEFEVWFNGWQIGSSKLECDARLTAKKLKELILGEINIRIQEIIVLGTAVHNASEPW